MLHWFAAKKQARKLFNEAKRHIREKRYEDASLLLTQAIQLAPSVDLYDYRGVVYTLMQTTEQALQSFTQALLHAATHEEQARIYFHRCLLYGRAESYAQALLEIQHALLLVPKNTTYQDAQADIAQHNQCIKALDDTPAPAFS